MLPRQQVEGDPPQGYGVFEAVQPAKSCEVGRKFEKKNQTSVITIVLS